VFLCGQEVKHPYHDLRHNLKDFLDKRMGCEAFLGEQIEEIKIKTTTKDHLSIEVEKARQSDLVVIFLESPGAICEMTAFALDNKVNAKLLVFNDIKFHGKKSFINLGPLKLLRPDQIEYYDPDDNTMTDSIVSTLDLALARAWFTAYKSENQLASLSLEEKLLLFVIYATYPVKPIEIRKMLRWINSRSRLRGMIIRLRRAQMIAEDTRKISPSVPVTDLGLVGGLVSDISTVRLKLIGMKLKRRGILARG